MRRILEHGIVNCLGKVHSKIGNVCLLLVEACLQDLANLCMKLLA
jgi:hypothetical protein